MHSADISGIILASLLAACGASKPNAPVLEVAVNGDTVVVPYGDVTEAAWLGQERWAVIAPAEESVGIVDAHQRTSSPVGGRTFRELRNPSNVFVAQDTLYIGDWGRRRLTLWAPPHHLARAIPAPAVTRGTLPRARDAAGRYYLDQYPSPG